LAYEETHSGEWVLSCEARFAAAPRTLARKLAGVFLLPSDCEPLSNACHVLVPFSGEKDWDDETERDDKMPTGTVKWFNSTKGFGFIEPEEGGKDAFVHITAVQQAGLTTLRDGQKVSYQLAETDNGRMAAHDIALEG